MQSASPLPDSLASLRDRIARIERNRLEAAPPGIPVSTAIDTALPEGGLGRGALHDVLAPSEARMGAALGFCAMLLARSPGTIVWIDALPDAWPPGLQGFGLDSYRLLLVPAPVLADALWAMEESLRCPDIGGVFLMLGQRGLDLTAARRLQLAAEAGGGIGLLLRLTEAGRSVALTRWRIAALPSLAGEACWQVDLLHSRRGRPQSWQLGWDKALVALVDLPA
jgi:protein ImuA